MNNILISTKVLPNRYVIKKETIEWLIIIILLLISFINMITLIMSLFLLLLFLIQKEIGAIKIVNFITLRTIINPGISPNIGDIQYMKSLMLFVCSIYLLNAYFKLGPNELKKVNSVLKIIFIFTLYNIFTALIFSSLPTISIFKLINFVVIFGGVYIGIAFTHRRFDWINWLLRMFLLLMASSFAMLVLKHPAIYLRNGYSFQGLTNHPNMFGILAVLFLAIFFSNNQIRAKFKIQKLKIKIVIFIPIVLYMVILSQSRTAFLSCIVLLLIYTILAKYNSKIKIMNVTFLSATIILLANKSRLGNFVMDFLYKGQETGDILHSRSHQMDVLLSNFYNSPLFGNGFMVPVLPIKSYAFSFANIVEPGNLILAVLSYCGVIGFIIFTIYLIKIFLVNKKNFSVVCFLLISGVLISMGEMVFFSPNNIGIWVYMLLSLYAFYDNKDSMIKI